MTSIPAQDNKQSERHWSHNVYEVFKMQDILVVSYVPDAGHSNLISLCRADRGMQSIALTTEEEGVALATGAYLGGKRAALLMQSSGVGNCINMLSMIKTCNVPFLTLVTMRGEWGEFNPWQIVMGQATPAALAAVGVIVCRVDEPNQVQDVVMSATKLAFDSYCGVAVLFSQRLIGTKSFLR